MMRLAFICPPLHKSLWMVIGVKMEMMWPNIVEMVWSLQATNETNALSNELPRLVVKIQT